MAVTIAGSQEGVPLLAVASVGVEGILTARKICTSRATMASLSPEAASVVMLASFHVLHRVGARQRESRHLGVPRNSSFLSVFGIIFSFSACSNGGSGGGVEVPNTVI